MRKNSIFTPGGAAIGCLLALLAICPGAASAQTNPPDQIIMLNAGTTGTALDKLAKLTGSPSTAVATATTDRGGAIGIVISGAGTTGSATIQTAGAAPCVFDGAPTADDYVQISSTAAGDCHDAGASYPSSGQIIGRIVVSGGTYAVMLRPEVQASSGGGGTSTSPVCDGTVKTQPANSGNFSPCTYGAYADPYTVGGATSTLNSPVINCPTCHFLTTAVGGGVEQFFGTSDKYTGALQVPQTTIATVNSDTQVTLTSGAGVVANAGGLWITWGHDDQAALLAAMAAERVWSNEGGYGGTLSIPCQGIWSSQPPLWSAAFTGLFSESVNGCATNTGTTATIVMPPNFAFGNCGTGCYFNVGVGFYGQASCNNFNIYNGGDQPVGTGVTKYILACGIGGNTNILNVMLEGTFTVGTLSGAEIGSVSEATNFACYNMLSSNCLVASGQQIILQWGFYGGFTGLTVQGSTMVDSTGIQSSVDIKGGGLLTDHSNSDINGLTMEGSAQFWGDHSIINGGALNSPSGPIIMEGSGGNLPLVHCHACTITNTGTGGLIWWYTAYGTFFDEGENKFAYTGTMYSGTTPGNYVADGHSIFGTCTGVGTSSTTIGFYGTGPNATTTTCTSATIGAGIAANAPRTIPFIYGVSSASGSGTLNLLKNGASAGTCVFSASTWCQSTSPVSTAAGDLLSLNGVLPGSNTLANIQVTVPID